jgi:hypothetical protein
MQRFPTTETCADQVMPEAVWLCDIYKLLYMWNAGDGRHSATVDVLYSLVPQNRRHAEVLILTKRENQKTVREMQLKITDYTASK